jgi:hypothetical protein
MHSISKFSIVFLDRTNSLFTDGFIDAAVVRQRGSEQMRKRACYHFAPQAQLAGGRLPFPALARDSVIIARCAHRSKRLLLPIEAAWEAETLQWCGASIPQQRNV